MKCIDGNGMGSSSVQYSNSDHQAAHTLAMRYPDP